MGGTAATTEANSLARSQGLEGDAEKPQGGKEVEGGISLMDGIPADTTNPIGRCLASLLLDLLSSLWISVILPKRLPKDGGTSSARRNKAIYERPVVKRGGADFCVAGSRTSPSPSASVDLADLGPAPRFRVARATRDTSSEPEAEGGTLSLTADDVRGGGRRDVIRSTISSGSSDGPMSPLSLGGVWVASTSRTRHRT